MAFFIRSVSFTKTLTFLIILSFFCLDYVFAQSEETVPASNGLKGINRIPAVSTASKRPQAAQFDYLKVVPLNQRELAPQFQEETVPKSKAQVYENPHIDVLTYHYDNKRSGWNNQEFALTPAKVKSPQFVLLKTLAVDGNVFAQPLLISSIKLSDGQADDLLIIVTGANKVYAFDANDSDYKLIWFKNLASPNRLHTCIPLRGVAMFHQNMAL